jgi:acyl-ACP thioesterase
LTGYDIREKLDMEYAPRKIALTGEATEAESFKIRKYQIDSNNHVNNVEYVKLAMEILPEDYDIHQVRVEYKKSAHYGDTLKATTYKGNNESRQVVLKDENDDTTAVVEFK